MQKALNLGAALFTAALLAAPFSYAADMTAGTYTNTDEVKWGDAPPVFAKGAKMAVLSGDPGKAAPFVARLMLPANYKIAPHWHSADEDLTIISGTFYLGEGDKLEQGAHVHALKAGGYHHLPAKAHHFAYSKGPTVVQINGMGPFDLTYINSADDPSKAPAKK